MSFPLGPHYSNQGPPLYQNRDRLNPLGRANKLGTYLVNVRLGHDIQDVIDAEVTASNANGGGVVEQHLSSLCSAVVPNSSIRATPENIQKLERLGLMAASSSGGNAYSTLQGSPSKALRTRSALQAEPGTYASLTAALKTIQVRLPSNATADAAVRLILMAAGYYSDDPEADIMRSAAAESQEHSMSLRSGSTAAVPSWGSPGRVGLGVRRPPEDFILQQTFADYSPDFTTEPLSGRHGPIRPALKFPYYLMLSLNTYVRQRDRLQYETEVNARRLIEREYNLHRAFVQGYGEILNDLTRVHASLVESAAKALGAKKFQERMRFYTLSRYLQQLSEDRHRMALRALEELAWQRIEATSRMTVEHDTYASKLWEEFNEHWRKMYNDSRVAQFHLELLADLRRRYVAANTYREKLFEDCLAQMRGIYTTSRLREQLNAAKLCKGTVSPSLMAAVKHILELHTSSLSAALSTPEAEGSGTALSATTTPVDLDVIIREAQTLLVSEEITFEMDEDEFVQLRTATG